MAPKIPDKYAAYECEDYFRGKWPEDGFFHDDSQMLLVVPLSETYVLRKKAFFAVGRSGTDGIDFGYRKHHSGLWAFYPIDEEFKFMADSIQSLVDGWCSGYLSV
ncbi:hypothetical protein [Pseudoduganella lutea]|uniref:Uncharacterized protein n=1 Tax=Pseudoduganella lutea TaxID=321985 RepID=A0A4P6KYY6_9BURK|nr:hypothetical protein [Pseudoduganella lutea]QBE64449.1 hypothetical protein EWM63_16860 [Pseudoduganella lutea]